MVSVADEKPAAPKAQAPQKPKAGVKLELGTEEYLAWGQPVNGLRAAIAIRPAAREPKPADMRELYLAVQNVSNAPIRLSDTTKARDSVNWTSDATVRPCSAS